MTAAAADVAGQLQAATPEIEYLLKEAGCVGLSVGVVQAGRTIHESHYGVRSVESGVCPDSNTIYHTASLTKMLTAAGIALLVDQGRLSWDTRVIDILPIFRQRDRHIESTATIVDLLAHRRGLAMRLNDSSQMRQDILLEAEDALAVLADLTAIASFRSTIKYNNWTYSVAGLIIERLSGLTLQDFFRVNFFEPLNLHNSIFDAVAKDEENYCSGHLALSDSTPYQIPNPNVRSGTIWAAAAGLKSSLSDLLRIYSSWLDAYADQQRSGLTSTPVCPWKKTASMAAIHNQKGSTAYGLGLFRVQLPCELGWIGLNEGKVAKNPTIAEGLDPGVLCLYHNGSQPGYTSSVHLLPETQTAIVVLCNSVALADIPDYVGAMCVEIMAGAPSRTSFREYIDEVKSTWIITPREIAAKLAAERKPGTSHRPLKEYVGRYTMKSGPLYLDVKQLDDHTLRVHVQAKPETYYDLTHYHDDIFAWPCDRDAEVKRAMFPQFSDAFRKIHFRQDAGGRIAEIWWAYARDEPAGASFYKA